MNLQQLGRILAAGAVLVLGAPPADAVDYVRLRTGQVVECAVLRQDTTAVFTTEWDMRGLLQPPLAVYERSEVESIWLGTPPGQFKERIPYAPRPSGLEGGGGLAFQTWAETDQLRRYLVQLSLQGGFDILRPLGLELDASFTLPFGEQADTVWNRHEVAFQALMNVSLHPIVWRGLVPFAVAGGGAAVGLPTAGVIFTDGKEVRNVVDVGLGVKWGANGIGYRVEWRHHYYTWTPDERVGDVRASEHTADMSTIRASLFLYR